MEERNLCQGCGKVTLTIHGRCANCWYPKRPELVPARKESQTSMVDLLLSFLVDLAWLFPGVALVLLGVFAFGSDLLLAIGVVILIGGGAVQFGDFL
jgi:hypothetical protein